jgi:hypothetical protein
MNKIVVFILINICYNYNSFNLVYYIYLLKTGREQVINNNTY